MSGASESLLSVGLNKGVRAVSSVGLNCYAVETQNIDGITKKASENPIEVMRERAGRLKDGDSRPFVEEVFVGLGKER